VKTKLALVAVLLALLSSFAFATSSPAKRTPKQDQPATATRQYLAVLNVQFHGKKYTLKTVASPSIEASTEQFYDNGDVSIEVIINASRASDGGIEAVYTVKIQGKWLPEKGKEPNTPENTQFSSLDGINGRGKVTVTSGEKTLIIEGGRDDEATSKAVYLSITRI